MVKELPEGFVRRTPSAYRNYMETRVGKFRGSKPASVRLRAFYELRDIVAAGITQLEAEGATLDEA